MYEKFGEFNTVTELNMAAEGLLKEGDTESLYELAEENGIDREDAQDYINGDTDTLATELSAALGKLDKEAEALRVKEIMQDWTDYIKILCIEDENICRKVKNKNKSLTGCIGELLKWSYENKYSVQKEIVKAAGITGSVQMGIPGNSTAKKIIKEYYGR